MKRIAMFVRNDAPTSGGSYSLLHTLTQEFCNFATAHEKFLILDKNTPQPDFPGDYKVLHLQQPSITPMRRVIGKALKALQLKPLAKRFLGITSLQSLADQHQLDLIYFPFPFNPKLKTPYITTIWDFAHRIYPDLPEIRDDFNHREKVYQNGIKNSAFTIVGNEAGKDQLLRFYDYNPEQVIPIPFPTPSWVHAFTQSENPLNPAWNLTEPFYFYPAQFWEHKNHRILLDALKILKDEHNLRPHLVLTGADKGALPDIQSHAKSIDVLDQCHFLGYVSLQEMAALYQNAEALLFPSLFGPDNLPPLEAAAFGCPILAATTEGFQTQLQNAALYFDPHDPNSLAQSILSLKTNSSQKSTLTAAAQNLATSLTPNAYIQSVFDLI